MYNVIVVHRMTGKKTILNREPLTQCEAETIKSKLTQYSWRLETIEKI